MTNNTYPTNGSRFLPMLNKRGGKFDADTQYPRPMAEAFIKEKTPAPSHHQYKMVEAARFAKMERLLGDTTLVDYLFANKTEREAILAARKSVIADADFSKLYHWADTLCADYSVWAFLVNDRTTWNARIEATKGRYDRLVSRVWGKIMRDTAVIGCFLFAGFVVLGAVVSIHDYASQADWDTVEVIDPEYKHEGDIDMGRYYTDAEREAMDNPPAVRTTPTDADIIHTVQSAGFVCNDVRRTQKINKGFIIECDGGLYTSKHNGASWKITERR